MTTWGSLRSIAESLMALSYCDAATKALEASAP
jgi:hypothetical protein